ncbi:hypothetical protein [Goodfellowiella coeruleoviolacea]|uniref:Uncharacterized protein n=1 Tax=Goodfellowiella coeruleoviolacea TaxID=334858 RepID=A0AAE3KH35_9PSEU|nr:hypothetical protein [Goodfellowiella coeruleoviolacea]MCP2166895.1 hypothetical protein [Goodfellowiella coeruleoviolacea]
MKNTVVDISALCDNRGIQPPGTEGDYGFNIWSNTFPAEELPEPGSLVPVAGVPFEFPARPAPGGDNIRCRGQLVPVPPGDYDWLYLLGAAERRTEDQVLLHYRDGTVRAEWLRMSDFWPQTEARFGEPLAFRTSAMRYPRHTHPAHAPSIWQQRVPVTVPGEITAVRLPDNPAMHVFALTLGTDLEARRAS